ncbi:U-box domain-containing protein 70-like [Carex rostrata]
MATAEVYVCLPSDYDEGKHILSWALSYFSKDKAKIVATFIIDNLAPNHRQYNAFVNRWMDETLKKHLDQCAKQKFKVEKLFHGTGDLVEGILELIDLRVIRYLVIGVSPDSEVLERVKEKANPSCKIWFIQKGKLIYTRYPKSDLKEATSEKLQRMEKLHQREIEEIQKRENDKNDLLKRKNEQLQLENQLLRNQRNENLIQLEDLNKQKQLIQLQLEKHIHDLEIDYNKLKEERNNAIIEAQELRKQKEHPFPNSDVVLSSHFSLSELEQATQNFSDSLKIGEGGFGCVYKGSLRKTTVAIKKLNSESLQGLSEFQQEVAILNRVRHPNIVNLIGSCSEISTLVYEFLPNGSLEDQLACADNSSSLTWQARIRIISEICLGLVFLHSNKPHLVIHGDLKPDNILLDANFISKVSDFGISKIIKQSDTNTTALYRTTHLAGTFAYIDPEFLSTGELTAKSDVYSFGIIVLRLLTGKRALNIAKEVQEGMRAGRLSSIVDKSAGKWPFDLAEKLAILGLRCADISRRGRPNMSQVWAMIEPLVNATSLSSFGSSTFNEEHVPSHFICPIMQEIMKNPCIAADGFTYEAEAIKAWLNRGRNTSPMTNLVLSHHDLIPNHVLRSAIQEWLDQHPQS